MAEILNWDLEDYRQHIRASLEKELFWTCSLNNPFRRGWVPTPPHPHAHAHADAHAQAHAHAHTPRARAHAHTHTHTHTHKYDQICIYIDVQDCSQEYATGKIQMYLSKLTGTAWVLLHVEFSECAGFHTIVTFSHGTRPACWTTGEALQFGRSRDACCYKSLRRRPSSWGRRCCIVHQLLSDATRAAMPFLCRSGRTVWLCYSRGSSGRHNTARRRRNWKKSCRTRVDVIALLADPIVLRSCRSKWVQFDHVKPSILHALALHALGVQDLRPVKFYKAMCSGSIVRWCTVCPRDLSSTMKRWHSSQCQVPTSWRCWRQRLPAWQKAGLELLYLDREREVSELFWVEKWWRTASAYVYFQARYRERCVAPQSV